MITLIGSNGSMGKRYQAILNFLKMPFTPCDIETSKKEIERSAQESSGVIIATPTHTHAEYLRQLLPWNSKILCEKPITKDVAELEDLDSFCNRHGYDFQMVLQYRMFRVEQTRGDSYYNYFRTGNDGLIWDCLQIIGLAHDKPIIENTSPVWECKINGTRLNFSRMDYAYVLMVEEWLKGERITTRKEIIEMHRKTDEYAREYYAN